MSNIAELESIIRNYEAKCKSVPTALAAEYLGIPVVTFRCMMLDGELPIGEAIPGRDRNTYYIDAGRLLAYKQRGKPESMENRLFEMFAQLCDKLDSLSEQLKIMSTQKS